MEHVRALLPARWTARFSLAAVLAFVGVVAVVVAGAWLVLRSPPAPVPIELPRAGAAGAPDGSGAPGAPATEAGAPAPPTREASATITVAAAGAVVRPGIYVVPSKSRVADVVTAAGGTLAKADLDQVNLAAKVADAERVFVPRKGQPVPLAGGGPGGGGSVGGGSAPAGSKDNPLDLNTATAEQLDTLPGVGPATAQAIISYRSEHGRFKSVNELLEVRGIGPAKFDALRTLVRVS
jgi:competence protein ComEA